jgi:hypothetical protein
MVVREEMEADRGGVEGNQRRGGQHAHSGHLDADQQSCSRRYLDHRQRRSQVVWNAQVVEVGLDELARDQSRDCVNDLEDRQPNGKPRCPIRHQGTAVAAGPYANGSSSCVLLAGSTLIGPTLGRLPLDPSREAFAETLSKVTVTAPEALLFTA